MGKMHRKMALFMPIFLLCVASKILTLLEADRFLFFSFIFLEFSLSNFSIQFIYSIFVVVVSSHIRKPFVEVTHSFRWK